ncbi:VOC family protein [Streptomyces sp. AV19]|uniref:VOC family protein n=1 Tax=Streptomyces sp. AV19 TaxID=2793068 RepID=UPI0018FE40AB|nr:VOC family protein [Streptomyces sp. AV19]MBH1935479.1 VOC family protein [Streptomyces sp. AV19]MDG4531365.1 VOC family protein [Streptomyces sp. AV19]
MPEVRNYAPGIPCWVDLMAPDQRAALDFYRDLFGWQGEPGPPETGGYAVCTLNGRAVAGIGPAMAQDGQPAPPTAWTTYFSVADAEAAAGAVAAHGGKVVMPPMDVLTFGRMAIVADPSDAVFGLWEARDFFGCEVVIDPGSLAWNELNTPDAEAVADFYPAALGVTVAPSQAMPGGFEFTVEGRPVAGVQPLDRLLPEAPPHWLTYFAVDGTDTTVDALVRAGGSVLVPPFDMVAGRIAVVSDPQGGVFGLIEVAPEYLQQAAA